MRILALLALLSAAAAPRGDGWSTLSMGDEEIAVYRDAWGIPHVFATSVAGAFWAEGWLEAQDRLWQMENLRRSARGESAELLGEPAVKSDLERRRTSYTAKELQNMFDDLGERSRRVLTAYAAGVNAFIKAGKLPAAYAELKHEPRPWHETDSIAIGVMMARRFGEAGDAELIVQQVLAQLEKKLGKEKAQGVLHDILRDRDPLAPTTLHDHDPGAAPAKDRKEYRRASPIDPRWLNAHLQELEEVRAWRESAGIPTYAGSNAWVVAPKKSANGHAMLYGGPMMGFKTPSICNEVQLAAPGLNVAGMSFPGVPGVMIGWNERIAWTTTSGGADLVDIYVLELNADNPEQYRYKGEWREFASEEAVIAVAGGEPRKELIRRSRYGPLAGVPDVKNRRAYTRAVSFFMHEQRTIEAVIDFNFAKNVEEFRASVSKIVTSHNFFCADRDGHIGFWFCGAHPVRRAGHDPRLPQAGDGSMDWEGILPFEKWPQAVDPAHGFFANWNNKPAKDWEPSPYGRLFWGKKIIDVLATNEKVTFEQVQGLARQTAYHDFLADYFTDHIVGPSRDSKNEVVAKALALLAAYDREKRAGRPEPVIVEKWVQAMFKRIFGDEFGILLAERNLQRMLVDPLLYMLDGNGVIKSDFASGADLKDLSREALNEVLKDGIDKLAWKDETADFGPKLGKVAGQKGRGTFQMAVELAPDGPRAMTLAAPGASELLDSPHYGDQIELFKEWKYKPFVFRRDGMK